MSCSKLLLFSLFLIIHSACSLKQGKEEGGSKAFFKKKLSHANEFKIEENGDRTHLTIYTNEDKSGRFADEFVLVKDSQQAEQIHNAIRVPCEKIICLSSTQLAYFFELGDISNIVGINSSRYLFNEEMNDRVTSGKVKRIGKEGNFNLEVVAALDPDVILVSPYKRGGFDALTNMGIPIVPVASFNERTPLGRAEWIKMMALFTGQEETADSIFQEVEERYFELKKLAKEAGQRPSVFSGKVRSGSWYAPGGDSFYAHFFRDAGAEYVIQDNKQGASPLDFESIYQKAANADFWRLVHPEKDGLTLREFLEQDTRYADFKAAREGNILLCNIREKPFYELSAMKPDVILTDYIYHFHPGLLTDYKPFFYEKLK